jgi:hypothetical protein
VVIREIWALLDLMELQARQDFQALLEQKEKRVTWQLHH